MKNSRMYSRQIDFTPSLFAPMFCVENQCPDNASYIGYEVLEHFDRTPIDILIKFNVEHGKELHLLLQRQREYSLLTNYKS